MYSRVESLATVHRPEPRPCVQRNHGDACQTVVKDSSSGSSTCPILFFKQTMCIWNKQIRFLHSIYLIIYFIYPYLDKTLKVIIHIWMIYFCFRHLICAIFASRRYDNHLSNDYLRPSSSKYILENHSGRIPALPCPIPSPFFL